MVCNVGASVERDGHAGGGALVQGTVRQGAQKKPGQLTNVGHALNEFFWPREKEKNENEFNKSINNTVCISSFTIHCSY